MANRMICFSYGNYFLIEAACL